MRKRKCVIRVDLVMNDHKLVGSEGINILTHICHSHPIGKYVVIILALRQ